MREKALQSRQANSKDARTGCPPGESFDELAIFGGRTGLVLPKRPLNIATSIMPPSGIRLPSIPNLLHPAPAGAVSPSVSHPPYRSDPLPQSVYSVNDTTSLSAEIPSNWEGLYREIPESSYYGPGSAYSDAAGPANPPGDDLMLEDRWSSFMHHYAMIGDPQTLTRH